MNIKTQKNLEILCPTKVEVKKYLNIWEKDEDLKKTEESIITLFTKTYPINIDMHEVLIKIYALDSAYNTQIKFKTNAIIVAQKILNIEKIDDRLKNGDPALIEEIGIVTEKTKKSVFLYSFATKYCSFHNQNQYPLFDSNVERALIYFKIHCTEKFIFNNADLREYKKFKDIVKNFQEHFGLQELSFRDIDKYLYLVGKEITKNKTLKT